MPKSELNKIPTPVYTPLVVLEFRADTFVVLRHVVVGESCCCIAFIVLADLDGGNRTHLSGLLVTAILVGVQSRAPVSVRLAQRA